MIELLRHSLAGRTLLGYLAVFVVPVLLPVVFVKVVGLGGLRSIFSYEVDDGPLHRLDPRIKLLYPFVVSTTSVILSWQAVLALVALSLLPWMILRPSPSRTRTLLTVALTPAVTVTWSQGLFHPAVSPSGLVLVDFPFPATISWIGTQGVSLNGLAYGAEQSGRLLVSISASLLMLLTTSPADMVWAFRRFRLPARAGFALSAALRFLPDLFTRLTVLLRAVEVRGLDLSWPRWNRPWQLPGYLWRILTSAPIIAVPLLIGALRSTATMAMVADARAFGAMPNPTTLKTHRTRPADVITIIALTCVVVTALVLAAAGVAGRSRYG